MKKVMMLMLWFYLSIGIVKADFAADIVTTVGILEQEIGDQANKSIQRDNQILAKITQLEARIARLEQRRKKQALKELVHSK